MRKGSVWQKLFTDLRDKDVRTLLIDSTAVRVRKYPSAALKKRARGKQAKHAMSRTKGGLTTKIYLDTDGAGNIRRIVLTGEQAADVKTSLELMLRAKPQELIGDKAYDADWLLLYRDSEGITAIILPKGNWRQQRCIDYKASKKET